jgi:hypothetical protein
MSAEQRGQNPFAGKKRIDSGSIHSLMCALGKRTDEAWTEWDFRAVAEVTLAFLLSHKVIVPAPPRDGSNPNWGPVGTINSTLGGFIEVDKVDPITKKAATQGVINWIEWKPELLVEKFKKYKSDPSFGPWLEWHIAREWEHHVRRLKSLIDPPFIEPVGNILGWSPADRRKIANAAKSQTQVDAWSKLYRKTGGLPPQEFIDGFALSGLLRGRYYWIIAREKPEPVVLQAGRSLLLEPVEVSESKMFEEHKTEVYLAGLITAIAMHDNKKRNIDEEKAIQRWADNVRLLKEKVYQIPPEGDHEQALNHAFEIAKTCGLDIPGFRSVEKHIEDRWTIEYITGVAIACATHVFGPVAVLIHPAVEKIVIPLPKQVQNKIVENGYRRKAAHLGRRFLSIDVRNPGLSR